MSYKLIMLKDRGLFLRIILNRKQAHIKIPVKIDPVHWSIETNRAKPSFKQHKAFNSYIEATMDKVTETMIYCISEQMPAHISRDYIADKVFGTKQQNTLLSFTQYMVNDFKARKQPKNASWIDTAVKQFLMFLKKEDIAISALNYGSLIDFRRELEKRSIKPNTINNYLRAIRNVYNTAIKRGVFSTQKASPFGDGLIPTITKSATRNITIDDVAKLEAGNFPSNMQFAVDMWLLGYYLQGADYIDVANLRTTNILNGYISFNRAKTKQPVKVKLTPKIQAIIAKYNAQSLYYLVPILHGPVTNTKQLDSYEAKRKINNRYTKAAALMVGIDAPITTKWLRHTWITIAKRLYIDESIRMQAVGHRNNSGSHAHYADDFEQYIIDAANAYVQQYINYEQYIRTIAPQNYNLQIVNK